MTLAEIELCSSLANVKAARESLQKVSVPLQAIAMMVEMLAGIEEGLTMDLAGQLMLDVKP